MDISGNLGEIFSRIIANTKAIDGKIIGEDGEMIKTELAKDDRQAWVNHLVEQYLKHEPLDTPPPDMEIVMKDIIKEISKREIVKIFNNGK